MKLIKDPQAALVRALTHPQAVWFLLGLAFIIISAGLGLRDPWPADEPRFALVAKHMVETGQWLFPVRGYELYADKPPLFMWALALCYALTGSIRWAFLLPSLLASLLTIGLIVDLTRRLWNQATAIVAGLMLLCLLQFTLQARTAQIDALLCAWVTLSLYGFWRHCVLGPAWRWYAIGGFAAGLGVITKGVGIIAYLFFIPYLIARLTRCQPLFPASTRTAHQLTQHTDTTRKRLEWRWSLAPLLTLLAIALWLIPMYAYVEHHATPELLAYRDNILFRQTAERYLRAWHHHQPFWYFVLAVIPWAWFPVSLILPWMLAFISSKIKTRDARYLLASITVLMIILFFSLSPGKREVYILPTAPWVAMLAAAFLMERTLPPIVHMLSLGLLAIISLVALYAMAVPDQLLEMAKTQISVVSLWELRFMAFLISISAAALIFFPKKISPWYRLPPLLALFWLSLGWLAYPALNTVRSSAAMMQKVANIVGDHEVAILQWREQYLLFAPDSLRLKYFAYQTPFESDIMQGKAWLSDPAIERKLTRYLLIPEAVLPHCQTSAEHPPIALGIYHRRPWWLVSQC
jgi:4-amino-4-deoxy-L-arabinose transferase-like glycosyltransferase